MHALLLAPPVVCPTCGAEEAHPRDNTILIRAYKVHTDGAWWSQCLVCSHYYDEDLNEYPDEHDPELGWFY